MRIVHTKTNVVQYNEYYPFGLQTSASWTRENSQNNFLYNAGSELNITSGWYETPFRNYDPVTGRFTGVDPLATKYASMSSYHYAFNSPVFFNDPSGAEGESSGPVLPEFNGFFYDGPSDPSMQYLYYTAMEHSARFQEQGLIQSANNGHYASMAELKRRGYELWEYEQGTINPDGSRNVHSIEYFWRKPNAQQGRPAPIDLSGSKKGVIDGILGHLVYMGHHPDERPNLSDIVQSLEKPTSWWEKLFGPLMGGGSETVVSGMAVWKGYTMEWSIKGVTTPGTDEWKTRPVNMGLELQARTTDGKNWATGEWGTIYQHVVWGGGGNNIIIYINFIDKAGWDAMGDMFRK